VTLLAGSFAIGHDTIYASLFWFVGLSLLSIYLLGLFELGKLDFRHRSNRSAAVARGVPADAVKVACSSPPRSSPARRP